MLADMRALLLFGHMLLQMSAHYLGLGLVVELQREMRRKHAAHGHEKARVFRLMLNPKRVYRRKGVARTIDREAAIVYVDRMLAGPARGKESYRGRSKRDDDREKQIAEKNRDADYGKRADPERPIPVRRALMVLVAYDRPGHVLCIPRHVLFSIPPCRWYTLCI